MKSLLNLTTFKLTSLNLVSYYIKINKTLPLALSPSTHGWDAICTGEMAYGISMLTEADVSTQSKYMQ